MAISRTVIFGQGKGGVGKTTLTTNVGALTAGDGLNVLVVDLDQQGNTARDLGFEPSDGEALSRALITGTDLPLLKDVRPNLDVVPGGPAVGDLAGYFSSRTARGGSDLADILESSLGNIADDYDLIVVDTPPGDRMVVEAALCVGTAVVIPTRMDEASIDGVTRLAERFVAVSTRNPNLRLAGVVLFAIQSRVTRLERDVRAALEATLGQAAPVFETRIRHLDSAAADARRQGLLVHELEQAGQAAKAARFAALRAGEKPVDGLYATNTRGLAEDYQALTQEINARVAEIEAEILVVAP
ncbi:MAG: ParA family protein [Salinibacterium sp.]|nr:MAG: ParA family protein [Salinibacterium sp.]